MNKKLLELYSDYIISSFGQITATGLSKALSGEITHDKVTRFLSREEFDSKKLWKLVKPVVREQEKEEEGVIIVDDTIEQKPYTEESELVCWHHDHKSNRAVKGINLVNYIYSTGEVNIPIGFDVVRKPIEFCSLKTQKRKRQATITKNELTRNHLKICQQNQIKYRYVLADSWFASKENMIWIKQQLKKHFIMALKSNRTVALSEEEKQEGKFTRIDSRYWSKPEPVKAWLKGLEFPILLHRQVFTNQDGSTGTLYLACSDLTCNTSNIEAIYQKRWKVEVFHQTLKSNTGLAKSPTRCVRTQINHIFMSIYAAFQLECLSLKHKMNHFALRSSIYIQALKHAMLEPHSLKSA